MRWVFGVFGLLFALRPAVAADPVAPVIAKVRRTATYSLAGGLETSIRVEEGVYYRSSNGLTYQSLGEVRGVPRYRLGRLTDHVAGKSYDVQLDRRRVVLRHRFCSEWPPSSLDLSQILGEETVSDIDCVVLPTKCNGIDCGRMWRSKEHHLVVRVESAVPLSGGATQNILLEYFDIKIGEEPPAEEINFLERFEVMDHIIPPPKCPE